MGVLVNAQNKSYFISPPKYELISTDLHIHTAFSDGSVWPNIRVDEALKEGLDLISITDHLEYQPHKADIPHPNRNRSYEIAKDHLGMSFQLEKSLGFLDWLNKEEKK